MSQNMAFKVFNVRFFYKLRTAEMNTFILHNQDRNPIPISSDMLHHNRYFRGFNYFEINKLWHG